METRASYMLVGAFVLALAAGLAGFAVWLTGTGLERDTQSYFIYFAGSVTGLQEGSPVRYRGVPIGTVTDIRIDPANVERVQVTVEVPDDVKIPADSVAQLELQGVTGIAYVQISGGTAAAPALDEVAVGVPVIESRPSTIAATLEQAPQLLSTLIDAGAAIQGFMTEDNQRAVAEILSNVANLSAELEQTVADADDAMQDLAAVAGNLNGLILEVRETASALAVNANQALNQATGTLATVERQTDQLAGEAGQTAAELRQLTNSLNGAVSQLAQLIEENREPIADFTGTGLYEFSLLITDLRQLTTTLSRVASRLERNPADVLFGGRGGVEVPP